MKNLLDVNANLVDSIGDLAIQRVQEIPKEFLDHTQALRDASSTPTTSEFHSVCEVPVAVHEMWLRQGYDMTVEPARNTLARLRREGLDAFITTNKRV